MRSRSANAILMIFLLFGFWYVYAGKGETMDTHTKLAVTGSALPQIDLEQPKNTGIVTFAIG